MNDGQAGCLTVILHISDEPDCIIRSIESVIKSDFSDFNLIIPYPSDLSEDSREILHEFRELDSRISLLRTDTGEMAPLLNKALDNASGSWITFLDSRDYLSPSFLDTITSSLCREDSPRTTPPLLVMAPYTVDLRGGDRFVLPLFNEDSRTDTSVTRCSMTIEEMIRKCDFTVTESLFAKLFRRDIIEKATLRFSANSGDGCGITFTLSYLRHALQSPDSNDFTVTESPEVTLINDHGYHFDSSHHSNASSSFDEVAIAGGPRKAVELTKRIYELSDRATSPAARSAIETVITDNLLAALEADNSIKELTPKERREIYELIYLLIDPTIVRKKMPWYFDILGSFRAWRIFDSISRL